MICKVLSQSRKLLCHPRKFLGHPRLPLCHPRGGGDPVKYILFIFLTFCTPLAFAEMPVIDVTSISREMIIIQRLEDEISSLRAQLGQLTSIDKFAKAQYGAITGPDDFGNISGAQMQTLKWAPSSWQDALNNASGSSAFSALAKKYQGTYQVQDATNYQAGASKSGARIYSHQLQTNRASVAASTMAFNQVNKHLENLKSYGSQIGTGKASDLKQAVDLNSRIQLEEAFLTAAELRMQALQNEQMAATQTARIQSESDASKFNQGGYSKP